MGYSPGSVPPSGGLRRPSGPGAQPEVARRRPTLRRDHLDSDPRQLRENLDELAGLLHGSDARVRRRVLLMFGELVARWQKRFSGESISTDIEFLPDAVRLSFRNSKRRLTPTEWYELVSPMILDLVDLWGIDRRLAGDAWFEFRVR